MVLKRLIIFLLSLPSGTILLLHVFGLSSMRESSLWLFFPASLFLLLLLFYNKKFVQQHISDCIKLGIFGGLIGTIGYDLIRIPFALMGLKVFLPI